MDMKVGDKVVVPSAISGLGTDLDAWISRIDPFMGNNLIEVNYCDPTPTTGIGGVFWENQLILKN